MKLNRNGTGSTTATGKTCMFLHNSSIVGGHRLNPDACVPLILGAIELVVINIHLRKCFPVEPLVLRKR